MARFAFLIVPLAVALTVTADDAKPQAAKSSLPGDGNRLAYLDEINPYYPHKDFAKLITPQWVGEEGVEAVVILSIDDMRDPARYETFLRPILDRLKKVGNSDGLSRMSIFTNAVNPQDEQLQKWLREGLSFEVHTITHPCPCLGSGGPIVGAKPGGIEAAKQTYDGCVDLLFQIPNFKGPVAFRMPCCDSMNSVSPRFFAEVMNKTTAKGNYLSIDSSVFNVFTSDDPALPRELVQEKDGSERFSKYTKFPGFVNTIENYPYPYVIGNMIWQFPCVVPSDWEAQHLHKPNNPKTVEDLKAALDCTVIKQGVFTFVFHPHGWIKAEQVVELIDHAEKTHGKKVKFLNFRDALERINKNLLFGNELRNQQGQAAQFFMSESDAGAFLHLTVFGDPNRPDRMKHLRWDPKKNQWYGPGFLGEWHEAKHIAPTDVSRSISASLHDDRSFISIQQLARRVTVSIVEYDRVLEAWPDAPFGLPDGSTLLDTEGRSVGLCLIDLNQDGNPDLIHSDSTQFTVYLFESKKKGWTSKLTSSKRTDLAPEKQIPPIIRADGTNNGFFVKGDALYWQNEDTGGKEPHHVKKITFAEILAMADAKAGARGLQAPVPNAPGAQTIPQSQFTTAHVTPPAPLSPEASLAAIKVRPGFRVELVAAEPLAMDPVAFDWGPDGKLWIVEMADYPDGMDGKGKPGGRVVYLEDTNEDGKYDKRTLFLDGIPFPTGVMVWKKGVLVTAAPDIFYAEDTDKDGKADKRDTLFTGFGEGNQQHRVNGLRWGLDGWIYLGNGDSGGNIKNLTAEAPPGRARADGDPEARALPGGASIVNVNGRDLRIREITEGKWECDAQSGQTQFGRERDDFGNWFGCNNSLPGWHYALEDHYLRRNPHVAPPNPRVDLTSDRRVYPISMVFSPSVDNHKVLPGGVGIHTSANSICIYRDDLYGPHYYGNTFVSEPVHNLIRRMVLKREGVTFRAERAAGEETSEFLASTDPCFRPNMIRTGPDGCLWFADMYRQTIEHPKWIPPAWQKTLNLREGEDKGRIYRIVDVRAKPRAALRMDKLDAKGLVAALDSPNGWQRDMAQMMLLDRMGRLFSSPRSLELLEPLFQLKHGTTAHKEAFERWQEASLDKEVVSALEQLAIDSPVPQVRVQAMAVLQQSALDSGQLFLLSDRLLLRALADKSPVVRRMAIWCAEARFQRSIDLQPAREVNVSENLEGLSDRDKTLKRLEAKANAMMKEFADAFEQAIEPTVNAVVAMTDDLDPNVRQQLASTLGALESNRASKALAILLIRDSSDPYIRAAAMSSVPAHLDNVLSEVLAAPGDINTRAAIIEQLITMAVATDKLGAMGGMLEALTQSKAGKYEAWQLTTLARLFDALAKKNITLAKLRESASPKVIAAMDRLPELLKSVQAIMTDAGQSEELRIAAIGLFSRLGEKPRLDTFSLVLGDLQSPPAVRQAAISAMARLNSDKARSQLLAGWSSYSPALRASVMDELLRNDKGDGAAALVSALEAGIVSRHDIDAARRQPLLTHQSVALRNRATKLLGGAVAADRQKIVEQYEKHLALSGDAARGRAVFEKNCAACHRLGNIGSAVGPDLQRTSDRSGAALVMAVFDPNRAVEAKYVNYLAQTSDGEKITGIITTETGTSLTMVGVDGKPRTLLRKDLATLRSLGLSLMPEGLEQAIDGQAMADLVAFVSSTGLPPKTFENNKPATVKQAADGSLTLPASAAEVYGPTIIFEQQYRNLGYWSSEDDHAVWTVEVTKAGKYEVTLDYALIGEVQVNAFQLLVADQKLTGRVPSTGNWDTYVKKAIGTIELKAGTHRLTFRSAGKVSGALIDLRGIELKKKE